MKEKSNYKMLSALFLTLVLFIVGCEQLEPNSRTENITTKNNQLNAKGISLEKIGTVEDIDSYTEWYYKKDDLEFTLYKCDLSRCFLSIKNHNETYLYPVELDVKMTNERRIVMDNGKKDVGCYVNVNFDVVEIEFKDKEEWLGTEKKIELTKVTDSIPKLAVQAYLRYLEEKHKNVETYDGMLLSTCRWEQIEGDDKNGKIELAGRNGDGQDWKTTLSIKEDSGFYLVYENDKKVYEYVNELNESKFDISNKINTQEKDNSSDLFISAIEHYIEKQKSNKNTKFYQLKDVTYSKKLRNPNQETINVKVTTADGKHHSKEFQVKKGQSAYYVINNGTILFEYIPNTNYISEVLREYHHTILGENIEGVCYHKYNVGKTAEEIRLDYKDEKKNDIHKIYYLRTGEELKSYLLYDDSFHLVYKKDM